MFTVNTVILHFISWKMINGKYLNLWSMVSKRNPMNFTAKKVQNSPTPRASTR